MAKQTRECYYSSVHKTRARTDVRNAKDGHQDTMGRAPLRSSKGKPLDGPSPLIATWMLMVTHLRRVEEIAKKRGINMAQVAVAWTLAKDAVTAPIVGSTKLQNLEDIIGTSRWM